jgi:hypothetical protein
MVATSSGATLRSFSFMTKSRRAFGLHSSAATLDKLRSLRPGLVAQMQRRPAARGCNHAPLRLGRAAAAAAAAALAALEDGGTAELVQQRGLAHAGVADHDDGLGGIVQNCVLVHHASWLIGVMPQAQRCSGRRILTGESFLV